MATVMEEGENFTWGVRRAPLERVEPEGNQEAPEQGQGRAFQARENSQGS